ncbi:ABC transporter permease [Pseudolabrys taiwanensis]|uniref:ABC transporter permease n=1 Tax=Pseudolabrys taiwanensis TaxID=331696 RepID=A0A345ZUU2_9HYPH|nr:ABC transporter permease [Pseudolabrys taiwanensis]AXK80689.1 ABC transporter permease [Pseudolabrys taiwanensis]
MLKNIAWRLLGAIPVLLLVMFGVFVLVNLAPGDAATLLLPEDATPEQVASFRAAWGLDQPLLVQFWRFLVRIVHLDLGTSLRYQDSVGHLIAMRLPATLELALVSLALAVAVGVPVGTYAALKKGKLGDGVVSIFAVAGVSAPSFWTGILLVLLFSATLNLLPSGSRLPFGVSVTPTTGFYLVDTLIHGDFDSFRIAVRHIVLPAVTLAFSMVGIIARITRSAIVDVGQEEFVYTAVAKGLSRGQIVRRHLLPNAAIPISTIVGLELGSLISGTIIVEVIFSWPGVGTLLYQSVTVRDTQLTIGVVLVYTSMFIVLNVLIDLFYYLVDPRMRSSYAKARA